MEKQRIRICDFAQICTQGVTAIRIRTDEVDDKLRNCYLAAS